MAENCREGRQAGKQAEHTVQRNVIMVLLWWEVCAMLHASNYCTTPKQAMSPSEMRQSAGTCCFTQHAQSWDIHKWHTYAESNCSAGRVSSTNAPSRKPRMHSRRVQTGLSLCCCCPGPGVGCRCPACPLTSPAAPDCLLACALDPRAWMEACRSTTHTLSASAFAVLPPCSAEVAT
jgi:hypothetical protein